jgi:DNA-binding XRE family transcriptional regulator
MSDEDPKLAQIVIKDGAQFARLLHAARITSKVSAADLALRIGVTARTINQREAGSRAPNVGQAVEQLKALGYQLAMSPVSDD